MPALRQSRREHVEAITYVLSIWVQDIFRSPLSFIKVHRRVALQQRVRLSPLALDSAAVSSGQII